MYTAIGICHAEIFLKVGEITSVYTRVGTLIDTK